MSEIEVIYPFATPILPIFHGSAAASITETSLYGLPYTVQLKESGLKVAEDPSQTMPVVFATSDPLCALGYTLRRRLPDANMIFLLNYDSNGLFEVHVIFFTLKDGKGQDVTYEEFKEPLVLYEVEPQEGKTFLNTTKNEIYLGSEWLILGQASASPVAVFYGLHELAMAGIQIYTMDGSYVDMYRRTVESRKEGWDPSIMPFDIWSKMMGQYTYLFSQEKEIKLKKDFLDHATRQDMLCSGTLTHLNPQLQGPLLQHSFVPRILDLRESINQTFRKIYLPEPL